MNPYTLSLLALVTGLFGQALAGGLSIERLLRGRAQATGRHIWFALACGALLLATHHAYAIELALRTGLYDLRQALVGGLGSLFCGLAVAGLSRRT